MLLAPDDHPLAAGTARSRSPTWPTCRCCSSRPAPGSATTSTPTPPGLGVTLVPQAEVDGMRLLASLAYQGFGAAILPASAIVESQRRHLAQPSPLDGSPRRGPSGWPPPAGAACRTPARATLEVLRAGDRSEVPGRQGLHCGAPTRHDGPRR